MSDTDKVMRLREELPATHPVAYLNTGSVGPLPKRAVVEMTAWIERELREGRIGAAAWQAGGEVRARARAAVASVLGARVDEVALTHHTTEGLNVVIWGLDWRPGDEIVTTNLEHPAVFVPALTAARRFGAKVITVDLGLGEGDAISAIADALTPRTRLVALSHVAYCTGALLPVAEIAKVAHRHGALLAVDGAQSAGATAVDVAALEADFYAVPGQKWLCGPEDTGALIVRRERLEALAQTFVGYSSMARQELGAPLVPHPDARRFEVGSRHAPSLACQAASVEWFRDEVGVDWAQARIDELMALARQALAAIPGVTILTPSRCAGLLCFTVAGVDPDVLVPRFAAEGVVIRSIKQPRCLRASLGFFNTEDDVRRLAEATRRQASS